MEFSVFHYIERILGGKKEEIHITIEVLSNELVVADVELRQ